RRNLQQWRTNKCKPFQPQNDPEISNSHFQSLLSCDLQQLQLLLLLLLLLFSHPRHFGKYKTYLLNQSASTQKIAIDE
ncbi:MAG: hypothetical protein N7Q72_02070, partial [Spiroplasma sp. Tabriz.8]|nr:hypothetical protein [Spiroplasma sp. Tabriz.8]